MASSKSIRLPRLKIIHVMLITLVLAIVFYALTARPTESIVGVISLVLLTLIAPILWSLRPNPLKAVLANLPEDPDEQIAALEQGLQAANPADVRTNVAARYRLMGLYKVRKRYEEAVNQGRTIVRMGGSEDSFENAVRLELAACLDSLGRSDEAEAERLAASDWLDDHPDRFTDWLARGKLLDKQHRYDESARAYERALELNPPGDAANRDRLLIRLVLTWFHAGRPEEMMIWADRVIDAGVSEGRLYLAHRLAGLACSNLGHMEATQYHYRRAYEIASRVGNLRKTSDCLATLGDLHRLRGELDRAQALCLEAESLCPGSARAAIVTHARVMRARGQLAEALARLEQASRVGLRASSSFEARMQASLRKEMAVYKAELGQHDAAWEDLARATTELGKDGDPKLVLPCEAAWAWLLALRGDRETSVRRSETVLSALDAEPPDASTERDSLELVGRALIVAGEFERARRCWEQFLATAHPPIAGPLGHYYLGECRRSLGDPARALEEYRRATAPRISTHPSRLAEERIRELSESAGTSARRSSSRSASRTVAGPSIE
jgi:tetratricopeptide (TPR) repeat protein